MKPSSHSRFTPAGARPSRFSALLCALLGMGAGFCNGLLGAAGGILLVAVLPHLTLPRFLKSPSVAPDRPLGDSLARRDILATALAVMLPISAISGIFYWLGGIRPSWGTVTSLLLPAIGGGLVGALLLGRLPDTLLRRLFAVLVVISGIRMLF